TTTRAPSFANNRAVAAPIPVPPPLTIATWPSSRIASSVEGEVVLDLPRGHVRGRRVGPRGEVPLPFGSLQDREGVHELGPDGGHELLVGGKGIQGGVEVRRDPDVGVRILPGRLRRGAARPALPPPPGGV